VDVPKYLTEGASANANREMPTMQVITVSMMEIARCLYLSARKATSTATIYAMILMDFTASQER